MVERLVSRCQMAAGSLAAASPSSVVIALETIVESLPLTATASDRFLIRGLVGQVIGRVLCATSLDSRADIAAAFMRWTASNAASDNWRSDVCALLGQCSAALSDGTGWRRPFPDARVTLAMRVIDARFQDSTFTCQDVAAEMRLSLWHATRLLKQQTGLGLFAQLDRRRIEAAEYLLRNSRLSMKEIATTVGFGGSSQFGRRFRRHIRMTPVEYRRHWSRLADPAA